MMFRIIVLGDSDVGKSSFVRSFVEGGYKSNLDSTVGADFFFKVLQLSDCTVKLQIWDTAGGKDMPVGTSRRFERAQFMVFSNEI